MPGSSNSLSPASMIAAGLDFVEWNGLTPNHEVYHHMLEAAQRPGEYDGYRLRDVEDFLSYCRRSLHRNDYYFVEYTFLFDWLQPSRKRRKLRETVPKIAHLIRLYVLYYEFPSRYDYPPFTESSYPEGHLLSDQFLVMALAENPREGNMSFYHGSERTLTLRDSQGFLHSITTQSKVGFRVNEGDTFSATLLIRRKINRGGFHVTISSLRSVNLDDPSTREISERKMPRKNIAVSRPEEIVPMGRELRIGNPVTFQTPGGKEVFALIAAKPEDGEVKIAIPGEDGGLIEIDADSSSLRRMTYSQSDVETMQGLRADDRVMHEGKPHLVVSVDKSLMFALVKFRHPNSNGTRSRTTIKIKPIEHMNDDRHAVFNHSELLDLSSNNQLRLRSDLFSSESERASNAVYFSSMNAVVSHVSRANSGLVISPSFVQRITSMSASIDIKKTK